MCPAVPKSLTKSEKATHIRYHTFKVVVYHYRLNFGKNFTFLFFALHNTKIYGESEGFYIFPASSVVFTVYIIFLRMIGKNLLSNHLATKTNFLL